MHRCCPSLTDQLYLPLQVTDVELLPDDSVAGCPDLLLPPCYPAVLPTSDESSDSIQQLAVLSPSLPLPSYCPGSTEDADGRDLLGALNFWNCSNVRVSAPSSFARITGGHYGGVRLVGCMGLLSGCLFEDVAAEVGSGLSTYGSRLVLVGSNFTSCSSLSSGGAVAAVG